MSGTVAIGGALLPGDPGFVRAVRVAARAPRAELGETLDIAYDERVPHAYATISGRTFGGRTVMASVPAP